MKDYKKILEDVVNIINTTEKSDIGFANICTYIGENCPELAASKDERTNVRRSQFGDHSADESIKNSPHKTETVYDCNNCPHAGNLMCSRVSYGLDRTDSPNEYKGDSPW